MASETKHTPRFWVVECPSHHPGMVEVVGPAMSCRGFTVATDVDEAKAARIEADARLIAAAPDMYEALKAAHRALQYYEWYSNPKSGWALPENESLRGKVDAALAKAEGR